MGTLARYGLNKASLTEMTTRLINQYFFFFLRFTNSKVLSCFGYYLFIIIYSLTFLLFKRKILFSSFVTSDFKKQQNRNETPLNRSYRIYQNIYYTEQFCKIKKNMTKCKPGVSLTHFQPIFYLYRKQLNNLLTCNANQLTGFYTTRTIAGNGLIY